MRTVVLLMLVGIFTYVTLFTKNREESERMQENLILEDEVRLLNLKQLTFSGENAEAYFSNDEKQLIFQSHDGDSLCDQIYIMDIETGAVKMVSTGAGVTTCSFFYILNVKKLFILQLIWEIKAVQKNQTIVRDMFGSFIQTMIFF